MRHPFLLACWAILLAIGGYGFAQPDWFAVLFLASPVVALATLSVVWSRGEQEMFRPGWRYLYRAASATVALASLAGLFTAAARFTTDELGELHLENGALGLFFLLSLLGAWPAMVRATPRRAALPGVIVHVGWLPLVLWDLLARTLDPSDVHWHELVWIASVGVLLLLSTLTSILSLVAFGGAPERLVTTATRLS